MAEQRKRDANHKDQGAPSWHDTSPLETAFWPSGNLKQRIDVGAHVTTSHLAFTALKSTFAPYTGPRSALTRSRALRSLSTRLAFSNCDTAPRICPTITAVGVSSVK